MKSTIARTTLTFILAIAVLSFMPSNGEPGPKNAHDNANFTIYSSPFGIQFELPDDWEKLNVAMSLAYGAANRYFVEGQSRERARRTLRQMENVVVVTSNTEWNEDPGVFFQINFLPLPKEYPISQRRFANFSKMEKQDYIAAARASSDQTISDMNASMKNLGTVKRVSIAFSDTDHLKCTKTVFESNFFDNTQSISNIFACPIGDKMVVIEASLSGTATQLDRQLANRATNSVRELFQVKLYGAIDVRDDLACDQLHDSHFTSALNQCDPFDRDRTTYPLSDSLEILNAMFEAFR